MSNNVIDFTSHWLKKEESKEATELDDLHDICTWVANEVINSLSEDYNIETENIEFSPEIIFFFEAFAGLILKAAAHRHPFQDLAQDFFESQNIQIIQDESGDYKFVIGSDGELDEETKKMIEELTSAEPTSNTD